MFSVIIPLYNKEPYILKAVESVLQQTFTQFELIIIDDGSTDGSVEKISTITDERVLRINQPNAGVSAARNRGAQLARYEYLTFLDADDWWHPSFLEEMLQLLVDFPEAALYGSRYFIVKNNLCKPDQVGVETGFKSGYIDYFGVYAKTFWVPINCSFVVLKKAVFMQQGGFNPKLKFGEDFELWSRIAVTHKVGYINKHLAYSNQDADATNRALGSDRLWKIDEHVLFNIGHLEVEEEKVPSLKLLLDGLRARSLLTYHIKQLYTEKVNACLSKVVWPNQPGYYRLMYNLPVTLVQFYLTIKRVGSLGKGFARRLFVY